VNAHQIPAPDLECESGALFFRSYISQRTAIDGGHDEGAVHSLTALVLAGSSTVDVQKCRDGTPVFDLYSYLRGETTGWGMVQHRKRELVRQFVVRTDG